MRITATVFEDTDNDGVFSAENIPLSNVFITLIKSQTECISSPTDVNGQVIFDNLTDNISYTIYETNKNINSVTGMINDTSLSQEVSFDEYFNKAIFTQPQNGYISTTPRKYIINPTTEDKSVEFGHNIFPEFVQDYKAYTVNDSGLYKVNLGAGTIDNLGSFNANINELNGLAYNITDNLLYCYGKSNNVGGFYRIYIDNGILKYNKVINIYEHDGSIKNLNLTPITLSDIDNKGIYYSGYISDTDAANRWFGLIDFNPESLNCFYYKNITIEGLGNSYIADWSYSNAANKLYSFINRNVSGSNVNKVVSFTVNQNPAGEYIGISSIYDTDSNAIKDNGNLMLSSFAYDDGNLYLLSNTSSIYRVNTILQGKLFLEYFSKITTLNALGNGANISSEIFTLDFGNAPEDSALYGTAEYKTKLSSRGPMNIIDTNIYIGDVVYSKEDAIIGETASDNDGISALDYPLKIMDTAAQKYFLNVKCYNNTGKTAYLYGWLDFNSDGIFDNNEFAFNNKNIMQPYEVLSTGYSSIRLEFNRPGGYISTLNKTFIRLRLTTDLLSRDPITDNNITLNDDPRSVSFYGAASDGETEDYVLTIGNVPNIYCYKYADKEYVNSTERLEFTIEVNNYGSYARNIVVTDNISQDMTFISGNYSINDGNVINFTKQDIDTGLNIGDLNRNDRAILKVTVKVNELLI